jgi:hypothetical protein
MPMKGERATRPRAIGQAETATRRAVIARDAGLRRISTVTRWVIAGAVGLSGALALIAANAFHGRTISNSSSSQTPATQQAPATPAIPSVSQGPQAPQQAPAQTPATPVVVSGGS